MNQQSIERNDGVKPAPAVRPRLAIVVSHPIQHFCPMYRSIAADGRVELRVVFAIRGAEPNFDSGFGRVIHWQEDLLKGFDHRVVTAAPKQRETAVVQELDSFSPDVVYVHGYASPYARAAMRWAKRRGVPVLMATDSELLRARPLYVRALKRLVLPWILRNVDMFLTVGDENERYFKHYGVSDDRFHRVPFSIDSFYYDQVLADRAASRNAIRQQLGIPSDAVVILTVGKLTPTKCQADLVRAFGETLKSVQRPAFLLVAGDGVERERVEELAKPFGSAVKLLGFIGVDQLPKYYVAADIYAHPSSLDAHPLAISEALYCSLPVVVSDQVGSIGPEDDVQVGKNGWVYGSGDVAALSAILVKLIDDPGLRESAGKASRELGEVHAADRCGSLFIDGAFRALQRRQRARAR
jgi:glycosyltransferase involved in cell wall biosynthesis